MPALSLRPVNRFERQRAGRPEMRSVSREYIIQYGKIARHNARVPPAGFVLFQRPYLTKMSCEQLLSFYRSLSFQTSDDGLPIIVCFTGRRPDPSAFRLEE